MRFMDDLIKISNALQDIGFRSFAKDIDEITEPYSEKILDPRFVSIFDSLKNAFKSAAADASKPHITDESLSEIFMILDSLQKSEYVTPAKEYFVPKEESAVFIPREFFEIAMSLAEQLSDKKNATEQLKTEQDPEKIKELEHDIRESDYGLSVVNQRISNAKNNNPEDYEKYYGYVEQYVNAKVNKQVEPFRIIPM